MSTIGPAAAIATLLTGGLVTAGLATIVLRTRRPPAVPPATPPARPRTVAELVQLRAEAAAQAASRAGRSVGVEPTPLLPASSVPVGVGVVGHDPDRGAPPEVEAVQPPSRPAQPQVTQRNDRAETAPAASWTAPARNGVGDPPWARARWISRVEGPEPLPAAPDRPV